MGRETEPSTQVLDRKLVVSSAGNGGVTTHEFTESRRIAGVLAETLHARSTIGVREFGQRSRIKGVRDSRRGRPSTALPLASR